LKEYRRELGGVVVSMIDVVQQAKGSVMCDGVFPLYTSVSWVSDL
jgi:hypothetical protein